jgi:hypothetical protein
MNIDSIRDIPEVLGTYTVDALPNADLLAGISIAFIGGFLLLALLTVLALYIFTSVATQKLAKRLKYKNSWMAWIPILQIHLLLRMAKLDIGIIVLFWIMVFLQSLPSVTEMPAIYYLLIIIASLGVMTIYTFTFIKLCERIGYNKWLGLISLTQIGSYVLLGMLAWGKQDSIELKHQEV